MDLPVWCILAAVLLLAVQADPTDQGPQKFSEPEPAAVEEKPVEEKEKKQHKRHPKYEEVILYLTPSQIKAYESGKGLMTPQQAAELRALEGGQEKQPQQQQAVQYEALEKPQLELPQQSGQFKSYEAGPGLVQQQQEVKYPAIELAQLLQPPQKEAQVQVPHLAELDLSSLNEQFKQQMKNSYNWAGQKLQKEIKKIEVQQKEKIQLRESAKNKEPKEKELPQYLPPENNEQQLSRFELQNREKQIELPLPLQFIPQDWSHIQQHYGAPSKQLHFEPHFITPLQAQQEPQLIPIAEHPQLKHLPLQHEKTEQGPQNYAYLYFYPHGKPINNEKLQLFYPQHDEQKPKELFVQPEEHSIFNLHPKYQLVPYEYAYENKLEAQKILQAQLAEHELDPHRLEAQKLEAHQLEDFEAQQFLFHKHLEAQFQEQNEASRKYGPQGHQYEPQDHKYEPQELTLKIIPHTAALRAQASKKIKVDLKTLHPLRQQEMKDIYEAQMYKMKKEKEEKEAQRLDAQLKEEEQKAEQFKAEQMREELFKNQDFRDELFKNQEFRDQLFKNQEFKNELFKSQEFKQELFRNQDFKDEVNKQQEFKGEQVNIQQYNQEPFVSQVFKGEMFQSQQSEDEKQFPDLGYLEKQEPKKSQMYSILSPLFQGHSIMESLQQQKNFPHHKINLETGFKPLQYAPKFNDERYSREVEKLVKRNHVEKQKALAKAAAIANEPPQIIRSEEKIIEKIIPSKPMIKHVEVPVPTPVMVPVPTPYEVKVPQPYPVPMEIIRPYPVQIVKTEKVEVPKPVPVEIEKQIPMPVPKTVYVVEKPYFVQKMAPVEVKREIPKEIPLKLKTPIKFSIIKHVWER